MYRVVAGDLEGRVVEDGVLEARGEVVVQGRSDAVFIEGAFHGRYGTLTLKPQGSWIYELRNDLPSVQALAAGDRVQDRFVATSYAGATAFADFISIHVSGANDPAIFSGELSASLNAGMTTSVSGQAGVLDVDAAEKGFRADDGLQGLFGSLRMSESGSWTYSLAPASRLALLNARKTVTEELLVSSIDGTTTLLTIRIDAFHEGSLPLVGTDSSDTLSDESETGSSIHGLAGDDHLRGGTGDDVLDGGAGLDVASYALGRAAYRVERVGRQGEEGVRVTALQGGEGVDSLSGVERLHFADGGLALDLDGHAGVVARVLGAVFGAASVGNAFYAGIGLGLLDGGMSAEPLAALALEARLGAGASHEGLVELLYTHVVGVAPAASERDRFVALLDNGEHTPGSLAMLAAQTAQNEANIDLVGLAQTGLAYLPVAT